MKFIRDEQLFINYQFIKLVSPVKFVHNCSKLNVFFLLPIMLRRKSCVHNHIKSSKKNTMRVPVPAYNVKSAKTKITWLKFMVKTFRK